MIYRTLLPAIEHSLAESPAVARLGLRQAGKTTLARIAANERPVSLYLDLERPFDLAKLADPEFRLVMLYVLHGS